MYFEEKERKVQMIVNELKNQIVQVGKLFDDEQAKDIISHITITFIENYSIYEFVLNESQSEMSINKEVSFFFTRKNNRINI